MLTDEQLLLAVQGGDTESMGLLVSRWERPLFRFAYRILETADDARDVCQETFLRILRKKDRFREGAKVSTWMYQIALNLCRDHLRRRNRWRFVSVDGGEGAAVLAAHRIVHPAASVRGDPAESVECSERRQAVGRALMALPREQREVVILKEYEGLKFREIAEILGCPESTVKSRMYYGLSGLKSALDREGIRAARG